MSQRKQKGIESELSLSPTAALIRQFMSVVGVLGTMLLVDLYPFGRPRS